MKKLLLIFVFMLTIILFSGCVGEEEKISEKNTTVNKVPASNNTQPEDLQVSGNNNLTVEVRGENSTTNPVKDNQSISKIPFAALPWQKDSHAILTMFLDFLSITLKHGSREVWAVWAAEVLIHLMRIPMQLPYS